jgi:hypothetical protein
LKASLTALFFSSATKSQKLKLNPIGFGREFRNSSFAQKRIAFSLYVQYNKTPRREALKSEETLWQQVPLGS